MKRAENITIRRRPKPPKESWWVGLSREEFRERARFEAHRMHGEELPRGVAAFFNRKWGKWKEEKEKEERDSAE